MENPLSQNLLFLVMGDPLGRKGLNKLHYETPGLLTPCPLKYIFKSMHFHSH